jgi:hypothetical protein
MSAIVIPAAAACHGQPGNAPGLTGGASSLAGALSGEYSRGAVGVIAANPLALSIRHNMIF